MYQGIHTEDLLAADCFHRQTQKEPRTAGFFLGLAEREGKEAPRGFDKSRKRFGPKNAPERRIGTPHRTALPAFGTSMCLVAS